MRCRGSISGGALSDLARNDDQLIRMLEVILSKAGQELALRDFKRLLDHQK